jgi:hypothetical protein
VRIESTYMHLRKIVRKGNDDNDGMPPPHLLPTHHQNALTTGASQGLPCVVNPWREPGLYTIDNSRHSFSGHGQKFTVAWKRPRWGLSTHWAGTEGQERGELAIPCRSRKRRTLRQWVRRSSKGLDDRQNTHPPIRPHACHHCSTPRWDGVCQLLASRLYRKRHDEIAPLHTQSSSSS